MKSKEIRRKRTANLFRILLTVIFFVFLIVSLFIILFLSFSPSSWDGKRRFTVVIQDDPSLSPGHESPIGLFSIEPRENRAVYFILPPNTLLDVPYGYGPYPARSIYPLGLLDQHRKAGLIVSKSVQATLGIFIDGYIINKEKSSVVPTTQDGVLSFKKKTFSLLNYFKGLLWTIEKGSSFMDTNLTLSDQNALFWKIRSLRSDQIKWVSLEDSFIIMEDKSPDGTTIREIDPDRFELLVSGSFQDSKIRGENVSVEVVNAAGVGKLASSMALIFEHLGANVITTTTAKTNEKQGCQMIASQKEIEKTETVSLFMRLFNCSLKSKADEELQGDVRIILGEDFTK